MHQASLVAFVLYMLWLFVKDTKRRVGVSRSIWMIVVWLIIIGSRPVSSWFTLGVPTESQVEAYDFGNPVERNIFFILILVGLFTLSKRDVRLREVIRNNRWLFAFYLFWGVSVFWSDAPVVAFKRCSKDLGNLVMILVLLSEENPYEAIKAAMARCAFVLLPVSVLLIKYYPEMGRAYHTWSGEMMFTGVTTHKNSLGGSVLVLALFLIWDFLGRWREETCRRDWIGVGSDVSVLGLAAWLLIKSHSATAMICAAAAGVVFLGLALPRVRRQIKNLELYVIVGGVGLWLLNFVLDIKHLVVVDLLGRDLTLTTRTEIWPVLLQHSDGVFLGSGFNTFWSGKRLATFYNQFGIIQAHNGYLETYLNGGLIGVALLLGLLFASSRRIKQEIVAGNEYARVGMMFLLVACIYNFTEASFNKMGLFCFAMLLVITQYPPVAQEGQICHPRSCVR